MLERLRTWWHAFRERWIAARNPFDVDTVFEDSGPPTTVWPESGPDALTEARPWEVK